MRPMLLVGLLVLAFIVSGATASATVVYTFNLDSASVTYTSADFVRADTTLNTSQFTTTNPEVSSLELLPSCPDYLNLSCDEVVLAVTSGSTIITSFVPFKDGALVMDGIYTNDAVLVVSGTPSTTIPEPASLALLGTGALGLGLSRRRKRD